MAVYEFDPNSASDAEFAPGRLVHLVVGNRGRLLDSRRTPVLVTAVFPRSGEFEVEILAFEDRGRRWELGLEEVPRFQFARDAALASPDVEKQLLAAKQRFDVEVVLDADTAVRKQTEAAIEEERARILGSRRFLDSLTEVDVAAHIQGRQGHLELSATVEEWLNARGLMEVDRGFAEAFATNPHAGELVKGHAVVLAELGLCRYRGRPIRNPRVFEPLPKGLRAEHIIARLALMRELCARLARPTLELFRAAAADGPFPAPVPRSFVSTTFSREVANAHFAGGPNTQTAVIWRQHVAAERLFMTFLETPMLNHQFKEAEAILIADPANRAF